MSGVHASLAEIKSENFSAPQVDAVWPGWGHASENPALPAKLKELGVSFLGPSSSVMAALGDKIAANILAQTAGVPSIPWSGDGLTAQLDERGAIPEAVRTEPQCRPTRSVGQRSREEGF